MPSATRWLLSLPALALLTVLAMACGGGSKAGSTDAEVTLAANTVILTYFDLLSGKKSGQALIDLYAPECRQGVSAGDIDKVMGLVAAFAPELSKLKIEAVDLGKLNIETVGDELHVAPADTSAIRVKVDGKFVKADDYLNSLSGTSATPAGNTTSMASIPGESALTLVRRNGKLYVGSCDELQEFSSF